MKKLTASHYAHALYQALAETKPNQHDAVLDNFVQALREKGALAMFAEICSEFEKYGREAEGIVTANVTSAHKLSENEERELVEKLNQYVGAKVDLQKNVDENLVGGVMIKIGDELIDGSVKKNLKDLKNRLTK